MSIQYTKNLELVLEFAQQLAVENKNSFVYSEHLLYSFLHLGDNVASHVLGDLSKDVVKESFKKENRRLKKLKFSNKSEKILNNAYATMKQTKSEKVGTEHVLVGMLQEDCTATRLLSDRGFDLDKLIKDVYELLGFKLNERNEIIDLQNRSVQSTTPVLDSLTRDLNAAVLTGEIGKVIGREDELARVLQVLGRKTKNNPVLVGESGVGKTVIADALAHLIVSGNVPSYLMDKRVLSLDVGTLVAGTKYRGEFEERMKRLVDEIARDKNVILFIDEIHMLIGAGGSEGSVDAANILKPELARGAIQLLGATTFNEYQKHIEKDPALERRFSPIKIEEPSIKDTIKILTGVKTEYEEFHGVIIDDEAVESAVKLSSRYISDRKLPDKAFDVLDEAAAIVRNKESKASKVGDDAMILEALLNENLADIAKTLKAQKRTQQFAKSTKKTKDAQQNHVTKENVETVVSKWSGVPISELKKDDKKRLLELEDVLHSRVIGQHEAISAVAKSIRRSKSGIARHNRPIGSFMFLGPTGVGKTELAKALAQVLFGSQDKMIRIDMSEFMEKHAASRLVGAPPGYVGFEEGGQLTEKIRQNPYSVVLFDEIEKAHPDTFNVLLQVLDDGFLTDSKGRKVDFRNTIIIMTSNLGATTLKDNKTVGFNAKTENNVESVIRAELKKTMRPEFLNRIDEIVVFKSLTYVEIEKIVKLMVQENFKHLLEDNIRVELSKNAIEKIAKKGYDVEYGARPIRRVLQQEIEDVLSIDRLKGRIKPGHTVKIGVQKDRFVFKVIK